MPPSCSLTPPPPLVRSQLPTEMSHQHTFLAACGSGRLLHRADDRQAHPRQGWLWVMGDGTLPGALVTLSPWAFGTIPSPNEPQVSAYLILNLSSLSAPLLTAPLVRDIMIAGESRPSPPLLGSKSDKTCSELPGYLVFRHLYSREG